MTPRPSGERSSLALTFLVLLGLLGVVVLVGLGAWQLERRVWKLNLIAQMEEKLSAAPVAAPGPAQWPSIDAKDDAYRRVEIAGRFLNDRETLVQAATEYGAGFWVMTPLQVSDGSIVLINRGFVPPERRDPTTRAAGLVQGEKSVVGLMRMPEPGGGFLRANVPEADRWYSRDITAIATARGLSGAAPYFIDADGTPNGGGLPIGGLTVVTFRNNHLVYALTWFGLALMMAGATLFLARDLLKSPASRGPDGAMRSKAGADLELRS